MLSPLGEEVDVVFIVFEPVLTFEGGGGFGLGLFCLLDAQLLVEADAPLVGVEVFLVVLDPGDCLFAGHLQLPLRLHNNINGNGGKGGKG